MSRATLLADFRWLPDQIGSTNWWGPSARIYYPAGRPTPTVKHPALDGTTALQPSAFGALVKVTAIDLLADIEHLRAYTDVLACDLECSDLVILGAIVAVLERKQRQQADDVGEVLRLGRVRQIAASELHRLLGER